MNSAGFLRILSALLAGGAVMLFIVTVVLVVKYSIISSVILEIMSRKSVGTDEYQNSEQEISGTISAVHEGGEQINDIEPSAVDEYSGTVPASAVQNSEEEYTGTIPADIRPEESEELLGKVPASMLAENSNSINFTQQIQQEDNDEFVIQTDIIVIHADTALIDHL